MNSAVQQRRASISCRPAAPLMLLSCSCCLSRHSQGSGSTQQPVLRRRQARPSCLAHILPSLCPAPLRQILVGGTAVWQRRDTVYGGNLSTEFKLPKKVGCNCLNQTDEARLARAGYGGPAAVGRQSEIAAPGMGGAWRP